MNKAKISPGPWHTNRVHPDQAVPIRLESGLIVAVARYSDNPEITKEQAEANARLIAAAPELLEACEAALSWAPQLRQWQGDHPDIGGASLEALTRTLRTAIAHARGDK